jgi:hypothetical protein
MAIAWGGGVGPRRRTGELGGRSGITIALHSPRPQQEGAVNVLGTIRVAATLLLLSGAATACAGGGGGLGNILGSVLGGQGQQGQQGQQARQGQVQGTVRGVDRSRLALQLTNGQQVAFAYDQQTTVTYQNQRYAVTNLEPGDQVTAAVQETGNGGYYVSAVRVDRSVQETSGGTVAGNGTGGEARVQGVQGVVREIDARNGQFTLDVGNGSRYVVSLPYNVSRADDERFRALRPGEQVRFYGVLLNTTRIELRQFY